MRDHQTSSTCLTLSATLQQNLGVTREQAEGGAGVMLQFVQTRLAPDEFRIIADSIEAVSDLIGKAPSSTQNRAQGLRGWLPALRHWCDRFCRGEIWFWRWTGGLGPIGSLAAQFDSLDLPRSMIARFADEVIPYFHGTGGDEPQQLLRRVLR